MAKHRKGRKSKTKKYTVPKKLRASCVTRKVANGVGKKKARRDCDVGKGIKKNK